MKNRKILYVSSEVVPYLPESEISKMSFEIPKTTVLFLLIKLKSEGKKIIHCHGVFDLMHVGHIKHFNEAKTFGDILIISITPDEFVNIVFSA